MNAPDELSDALQAYAEKFDNLDTFTHPAWMENPRLPALLRQAVAANQPATRQAAEQALGPAPEDW